MLLRNPISSLPCVGEQADDVVVKVKAMTFEHVNYWHTEVQSLVDFHYQHWNSTVPPEDVRADVGWDWSKNLRTSFVAQQRAIHS